MDSADERRTLLFLDEPTSGLDGQSSYMILQFLRKLAARGQAVLCTIHQPSAALFAEFDQLLLLTKGGRVSPYGIRARSRADGPYRRYTLVPSLNYKTTLVSKR